MNPELHGGIGEALDSGKRHQEALRDVVERQAHLEGVVGDLEVPELMLENDGYLFRVLLEQTA